VFPAVVSPEGSLALTVANEYFIAALVTWRTEHLLMMVWSAWERSGFANLSFHYDDYSSAKNFSPIPVEPTDDTTANRSRVDPTSGVEDAG